MLQKTIQKRIATFALSAALLLSAMPPALAAGERIHYLANEDLAPGVHYTEEDINGYGETGDRRVRINHLSIDPSADGLTFRSARAEDTINAMENVKNQALRDVYQGVNVVAAINADSYNMDVGVNSGIQVREGGIVISQPNNGFTTTTPVFFIEGDGTPHIDSLRAISDITVGENYTHQVSIINRNYYGSWSTDQQAFDTLRIYTSNLTGDHKMTHYSGTKPEKESYALIELDNFDGCIDAGTSYSGKVSAVYNEEGFSIPENCIVLAGYAGDADGVSAMKVGEAVSYTAHLYTGSYTEGENGQFENRGDLCDGVVTAVNGFHLLAKNGSVNENVVNNSGTDINSRTVIGLTEDGKMEILCVNKPGANFSSELTTGTTFKEITKYMMEELHCVDVLNMDGGGSTEMVARRAGADSLETVSYPSDGGSRNVSNSLLIISDAPRTSEIEQVLVQGANKLYIGSQTDLTVKLTDASGGSITVPTGDITWSAERGTINSEGHYVAPSDPCDDVVTASIQGITGAFAISVVDQSSIASIGLNATGTIALNQGESYAFGMQANDADEQEIVIDATLVQWSMEGEPAIGTLGDDGVLTVTAKTGTAQVTAEFLNQTYSVSVIVGMDEQIIDDFEGDEVAYHISSRYIYPNHSEYRGGDGENMVGITHDEQQVKNGNGSLYWVYDTKDWNRTTNGTLYVYPDWDMPNSVPEWTEEEQTRLMEQYRAKAQPKKFGLWIYSGDENNDGVSDNYNCMMTAQFYANDGTWVDEEGETHYEGADGGKILSKSIKITPDEHMDWIGWKYFEFEVPEDWPMPITFNYLWMSNIYKGADQENYSTKVMLDDLKWIYTDEEQDLTGPAFSNTTPTAGGLFENQLHFSTVISDPSGVKPETITVTINDTPVEDFTFEETTGKLSFTVENLQDKENYRVVVKAKDNKGNESVPYIDNTYRVDLSEDEEGPEISNVTPTSNSKLPVQIPSPRIGFQITDLKSGVDPDSLCVTLNGKEIQDVYVDEATGWAYAQPDFQIDENDTQAVITIDAKDQTGNAMETYQDTVTVDIIPQPADPNHYSISVIPDTQGNAYSDLIFPKAEKSDSSLVVHLGDIVDGVNENEFEEGLEWIESLEKPALVLAGNHEGGNLDLDMYQEYFGSPTYSFAYGDTLLVILNSAFNQSVEQTDPTQYRFLKNTLEENTLPNVYIFNHVVTQDHFNTQHNMTAEECTKFENLVGAYQSEHPDVNVTVISGHLHTLETWEAQGVQYIIGGNAAGKGYVTAEQGNLLGIGTITVENGTASYSFDPLVTKIYLRNAAMKNGTLNLVKGASTQIDVYGDFREKAAVDSYMTQINDDSLVNIVWSSSDPEVATVSNSGVVTMVGEGSAKIMAVCGGESASFTVQSQDMSNVSISELAVSLPETVYTGELIQPTVVAKDVYGATIALDSKEVDFTVQNGKLAVREDGTLYAISAGEEHLTASYQGKTAECMVTILTRTSGGGSGSTRITVQAAARNGGQITPSGTVQVQKGQDITFNIQPDSGYRIEEVLVDGASVGAVSTYTFKNIQTDHTIIATFLKEDTLPFTDVSADDWYFEAVKYAYENNLMNGMSGTTFAPDESTTRAMLVTMLYRLNQPVVQGENPFEDVPGDTWYTDAVIWANAHGIVNGIAGKFQPDVPITREQLATMLYRYAEDSGLNPSGTADLTKFSDGATVSAWAETAMAWAVQEGLIQGRGNGCIAPSASATRAEVATILMRFMEME